MSKQEFDCNVSQCPLWNRCGTAVEPLSPSSRWPFPCLTLPWPHHLSLSSASCWPLSTPVGPHPSHSCPPPTPQVALDTHLYPEYGFHYQTLSLEFSYYSQSVHCLSLKTESSWGGGAISYIVARSLPLFVHCLFQHLALNTVRSQCTQQILVELNSLNHPNYSFCSSPCVYVEWWISRHQDWGSIQISWEPIGFTGARHLPFSPLVNRGHRITLPGFSRQLPCISCPPENPC